MEVYHYKWLENRPHRTEDWLKEKLKEGFDIHHIDGDHFNNDPKNLVLIECSDHMFLHSGSNKLVRISPRKRKKSTKPEKPVSNIRKDLFIIPLSNYYIQPKRGETSKSLEKMYRENPREFIGRSQSMTDLSIEELDFYKERMMDYFYRNNMGRLI